MSRRTRTLGFLAIALFTAAGGCAATGPSVSDDPRALLLPGSTPLGEYQAAPPLRVVSLGAGDALGRAIHVQDIILAAVEQARRMQRGAGSLAEVPLD